MNRLLIVVIISTPLFYVYGSKAHSDDQRNSVIIGRTVHHIESRETKTGHYFLYPYHGWYAMSWIYWIKVKLFVIAFFVGTAFIWAVQYIGKFYHYCPSADHIHYGHYRSSDDSALVKFLQNL